MNDYYPFLVEKVSKLEKISESRREVYKGAREELVSKLAHPALRVPEAEIAKECRAFDAAIQTIEAEMGRRSISDAGALDPTTSRASSDSSESSQVSHIDSESAPAIIAGETAPETDAPKAPGIVEFASSGLTDRAFRDEDIRALPPDGAHDSGLTFNRRAPGTAVAQTSRKQLTGMLIATIVCCLAFAAIYFFASVGK